MLSISNLLAEVTKKFSLNIPSMSAAKGISVILGPSGCGKSTLLRSIAGLMPIKTGEISLNGERIENLSPGERRIGMVFQDFALFPHMNVEQNIGFGLLETDIDRRARIEEVLNLVGLKQFNQRRIDTLSGGEKQRVAIARALAPNPKLLLLDEPFSALDQPLREQLRVEIQRLSLELKIPIIFVTHDQIEALAISNHLVYMEHGTVVEEGAPTDLYLKPKKIETAMFFTDNILLKSQDGEIICLKPWQIKIESKAKEDSVICNVIGCSFQKGKYILTASMERDQFVRVESDRAFPLGAKIALYIPLKSGWSPSA